MRTARPFALVRYAFGLAGKGLEFSLKTLPVKRGAVAYCVVPLKVADKIVLIDPS